MSIAFSSIKVGPLILKNHFMRSATHEKMSSDEGYPSDKLLNLIKKLADGEVGLIVPGYFYPMKSGKANPKQNGILSQKHADEWRETVKYCHNKGSKIVFQICHGGLNTGDPNVERVGPSPADENSRALTVAEIEDIIEKFADASKFAKNVGVDGVQLHSAHGYLFSQFMSPHVNHRTDKYGGSIENRSRIIQETVNAIKEKMNSDDFLVSIKMNGDDNVGEKGVTPELASKFVNILNRIDFFEISSSKFGPYGDAFNLELAEYIKKRNPNKIIATVGGNRELKDIENILATGKSDLISISRPFIRRPSLIKDFREGKLTRADCVDCSQCLMNMKDNESGVKCHFPDLKK
ncbi:NADPH dehydrogenase [Tritrichomonas foetus]|uniref:NADPH dehydrogenase n=1 Tax=Tritrichomonas foetus TaxID=1144522 RepID=A0A1J4JJX4_9EUKA|nr:NADPH dehydrogenase [Tritrichomonas foetus]|eukprot:OHS98663.1 NADPH dehydrogenase [Tritrichomonas foetus]